MILKMPSRFPHVSAQFDEGLDFVLEFFVLDAIVTRNRRVRVQEWGFENKMEGREENF